MTKADLITAVESILARCEDFTDYELMIEWNGFEYEACILTVRPTLEIAAALQYLGKFDKVTHGRTLATRDGVALRMIVVR